MLSLSTCGVKCRASSHRSMSLSERMDERFSGIDLGSDTDSDSAPCVASASDAVVPVCVVADDELFVAVPFDIPVVGRFFLCPSTIISISSHPMLVMRSTLRVLVLKSSNNDKIRRTLLLLLLPALVLEGDEDGGVDAAASAAVLPLAFDEESA